MDIAIPIAGKQTPVKVEFKDMGNYICRHGFKGGKPFATVSDYLSDAPPGVVEDLLTFMFSGKKGAPTIFEDYVSSEGFILAKRPVFLGRGSFTCTSEGNFRSLSESVQRLYDAGLVEESDISNTYITWTKRKTKRVLGRCHWMFRVISISPILDSDGISEECLDFVVYHEFLHIRQGLLTGKRHHTAAFRREERQFPDYERIQKELARIGS
jgi:hypothetical protein